MDNNENKQETVLSQWQTCVEMANAVSDRRESMNNLFVTVNLALAAAVSFAWNVKTVVLLISGIIECIIWAVFIKNYGNLNSAKFSIINELEKKLPSQPFTDEWKIVDEKKYKPSTKLELFMPVTFIALYVVLFFILIFSR